MVGYILAEWDYRGPVSINWCPVERSMLELFHLQSLGIDILNESKPMFN